MIIRRRWIDAEGKPHAELATWLPASASDERGRALELPAEAELVEGSPEELAGPVLLVALVDAAAETGADRGALYERPLIEGARLASPAEHSAAAELAEQNLAAARAAVSAEISQRASEREEPRRAALAKLADAAGLSPEERSALLGEAI